MTLPRIKMVHLLSQPTDRREKRSIASIQQFQALSGFDYVQHINARYTGPVPRDHCLRPEAVAESPGNWQLSPGHYGCFLAHRDGVLNEIGDELDGLLIFECDAILANDKTLILNKMLDSIRFYQEQDLQLFSYGPTYDSPGLSKMGEYMVNDTIIEAHAYLILRHRFSFFQALFQQPWDVTDLFYTHYLSRVGSFAYPLCLQAQGMSLIDLKESTHNGFGLKKV